MLSLAYRTRLLRGLCALTLTASFAGACGAGETGGVEGTAGSSGTAGAAGKGTGGARAGSSGTAGAAGATTAPPSKTTTNLFVTVGARTQGQVNDKVTVAVNRFFGIGTGEPTTPTAASGYRCYYELPNDASMGYIWAADSDDVRSEGMSYGMMIAVQMDLREQFDRLWKFAKTYMQYPASGGAWSYYFKWQGRVSGSTVTFGNTGPAPDGDEYFAAALYLADKRWGSTGAFNYKQEADNISAAMLHNTATGDGRAPIINAGSNMVVFYPQGASGNFTDPSYHLPAFYELFALYGPSSDAAKWRSIATTSRSFLVTSAHATTGLHPDYATFQGPDDGDGGRRSQRVSLRRLARGHEHGGRPRLVQRQRGDEDAGRDVSRLLFQPPHQWQRRGQPVQGRRQRRLGRGLTALTATLAAGGLASTAANRTTYVNNLWNIAQQSGQYRYYQESVYLLGLLATAGKLSYAW